MNKDTGTTDSIYRAVVEVLTNNYTTNLFSSMQRETLAKKVSHRIGSILDVNTEENDITHMGDKIIQDESKSNGITREMGEKAAKLEEKKKKSEEKKKNVRKKVDRKPKKVEEKKPGLKNLKK